MRRASTSSNRSCARSSARRCSRRSGRPWATPDRARRTEAIWFAGSPAEGTLVEVSGADAVRPEHVKLHILAASGAELAGLQNSFSRLAWARAHADTAEEALAAAREAIDALSFVTRVGAVRTELI
ncbi:hypothetical protein [Streptomyces sp. NPDC048606]|uniref:hypothetical protein n=1 Tax=Streptomyces sp. NPDC048606 TaxID=3154726 RepID=UPI00342236E2